MFQTVKTKLGCLLTSEMDWGFHPEAMGYGLCAMGSALEFFSGASVSARGK